MLVPTDPKTRPELLASAKQSLRTQPDLIVVANFNGITRPEKRRTCELSSAEQEEIIHQLTTATLSRVSLSKGSAIPPFYALDDYQGQLRLVLYIASGTAGEVQCLRTRSADLETLTVILSLCGKNHVSVPAHVLGKEEDHKEQWVDCSLKDIEAISRRMGAGLKSEPPTPKP